MRIEGLSHRVRLEILLKTQFSDPKLDQYSSVNKLFSTFLFLSEPCCKILGEKIMNDSIRMHIDKHMVEIELA